MVKQLSPKSSSPKSSSPKSSSPKSDNNNNNNNKNNAGSSNNTFCGCGWQRPAVVAIGFLMLLRTYQLNTFSNIVSTFSTSSTKTNIQQPPSSSFSSSSSSSSSSSILKSLRTVTSALTINDGTKQSENVHDIVDSVKIMIPSELQTELCDSTKLVTKEIMSSDLIRQLVKEWYAANKYELNKEVLQLQEDLQLQRTSEKTRSQTRVISAYKDLGRFLYEHAIVQNQLLLTVQAGGMDGKSNDPLFDMFVTGNTEYARTVRVIHQHQPTAFTNNNNNNQSASSIISSAGLQYWLPVVMEPMPHNFVNLKATYTSMQNQYNLTCPLLSPWAISYNKEDTGGCSFCHINVSMSAPQRCHELPDWMKYQLSTMDCPYFKQYFSGHPECWVERSIPCGSITSLLSDSFSLPKDAVPAILQIDIEGYESNVLPAMLNEITNTDYLPPIIHYEHKVMRDMDRIAGNNVKHQPVLDALTKAGYFMINDGEDMLCLLV